MTCEVIDVRAFAVPGSDTEEYRDVRCTAKDVGITEDGVRVCESCARAFEREGFVVHRLDRHTGVKP